LTPIQVADCGSTDGQGWDIITAGKHIEGDNVMLIVSTLTQACFNFDPRRQPGNQVLLFSCGGRADGGKSFLGAPRRVLLANRPSGGEVTNSQLFAFNGGAGPLSLQLQNQAGSCLVVKGNAIDIANCNNGDASQSFTFGDAAAGGGNNNGGNNNGGNNNGGNNNGGSNNNGNNGNAGESTSTCTKSTRTVTATPTQREGNNAGQTTTAAAAQTTTSAATAGSGGAGGGAGNGGIPTVNPTEPVPVSRAGGTLQPTAAAESHERDETATRAFSNVEIRAPNGQCLFIDPTAGDFRQNLIPISLVDCTGSPNEKWDVITEGKHNKPNPNRPAALVVSALVSSLHQGL
jgi:hypothetical protein